MKLVAIFRKRLDGFAVRVHRSDASTHHVTTESGERIAVKSTEREANTLACRVAQGGREKFLAGRPTESAY